MATKAKPWPKNAEYARMDSISAAQKIKQIATELVEDNLTQLEVVRLGARIRSEAGEIITKLNEVKNHGD